MTPRISRIAALLAIALAIPTAPVLAEDGVIEINQAKINASGFPIFSISSPGSYKLTSNITVTAAVTEAISIGASQVTLDLNGFSISGTSIGNADIFEQANTTGFVLKNGTIVGSGASDCVNLGGPGVNSVTIDHVTFSGCGSGIAIGSNSKVTNSTFNLSSGSTTGINCAGSSCLVENNVINAPNGSFILFFQDSTSLYGQNVINAGGSAGPISGGVSLGNNVCTFSNSTTKC